ncbi:MAG: hypothetical protein FWD13_08435 [Treponema sp.]|nr:hypothetical protein [Treponema sp.]
MKFKSFLVFIAVLLLFIPCNLFAQQSDFYGTWTTKISEDGETIFVKFVISASSLIMSLELYEGNKLIDTENIEAVIVSWAALTNTDYTTRVNYPNGFSITISTYGFETPIELFISRDKRQITIPELNEDWDEIIVFTKQ